jgi:uncharacterized protein
VLILLPPSEGKTAARRGAPLDLDKLSLPALNPAREKLLDALTSLCAADPEAAAGVLGLTPGQAGAVADNARLRTAATTPAQRLYSGVLYQALDLAGLDARARRRARSSLLIFSGLWGAVRVTDRLPGYKLPVGTRLPGIGPVTGFWRDQLGTALPALAGTGLVLDLRSSGYLPMWRPAGPGVVSVRVLHEQRVGGVLRRAVVSHFNKATKGRLVRALLSAPALPGSPAELVEVLGGLGFVAEPGERAGQLDVVVTEV